LESQEGIGTTFRIYLPRAKNVVVEPEPARSRLVPGHREWLLVVDDESEILHLMQQYLRKLNYRVYTRACSQDALATFRADPGRFAAVITDHTMPGLEGAALAEKLSEIRPDIPVILMTGLNQPPDFASSPYAAKRAVVRKPLDFADLSQRLRNFLDNPGRVLAKGTPKPGLGA
jgi:CheY-like chemotaxis protein